MAILSSRTIVRSLASLHLIIAYYFVTNPSIVATHNLVILISVAMGLPLPTYDDANSAFETPNPVSALLAAVLFLSAISDLAVSSMKEEFALLFFSFQAPIRLLFFFGLTAWSYSFRPGGLFAGRAESEALATETRVGIVATSAFARGIGNGLVFTWAFLSIIGWFWMFITLRDERREAVSKESRKRGD